MDILCKNIDLNYVLIFCISLITLAFTKEMFPISYLLFESIIDCRPIDIKDVTIY